MILRSHSKSILLSCNYIRKNMRMSLIGVLQSWESIFSL